MEENNINNKEKENLIDEIINDISIYDENSFIFILNELLDYFLKKNLGNYLITKKEIKNIIDGIISNNNNSYDNEIFIHIESFISSINNRMNINELTIFIHDYVEKFK